MRRMVPIVIAVFAAVLVVSFSTLSAEAQSAQQYGPSDGTDTSQDTPQNTAPDEDTSGASSSEASSSGDSSSGDGFVSQGSAVKTDSPEAVAAQEDLAEEERLPDYSQVIDNTTKGAFQAQGWKTQRGSLSHGGSFVAANAAKAPARFKVKIPTASDYSVYAWWPQSTGGGAARFGVQTASGMKWDEVDQGADGGMWVKIGTYPMSKGQRFVQIAARSTDGGRVVADAVAVVRGEAAPPDEQTATASGQQRSATTDSMAISRFRGSDIVRQARKHIGDRYRYGTCTRTLKSCTCLTRVAVNSFGHRMGMTEGGQWNYNGSFRVPKSQLRVGDEVFFKEGGSRYITHVGIYSGNGRIVHASSYWGRVVEKEMKYISGYFGAKRFKSR